MFSQRCGLSFQFLGECEDGPSPTEPSVKQAGSGGWQSASGAGTKVAPHLPAPWTWRLISNLGWPEIKNKQRSQKRGKKRSWKPPHILVQGGGAGGGGDGTSETRKAQFLGQLRERRSRERKGLGQSCLANQGWQGVPIDPPEPLNSTGGDRGGSKSPEKHGRGSLQGLLHPELMRCHSNHLWPEGVANADCPTTFVTRVPSNPAWSLSSRLP